MSSFEIVPYGGWKRALRLFTDEVELIAPLEVGPRVIRYGFIGEKNEFVEHSTQMGKSGGTEYLSYGGHRLWIAPEIPARTFQPENIEVDYKQEGNVHVLTNAIDINGVQKQIRIELKDNGQAHLEHRLFNNGAYAIELSPWALTQLAPGGKAFFPMPQYKPHTEEVLPERPMAMWAYTDFSDPRWQFSQSVASLSHHPEKGPQKLGLFVEQGYAAYLNEGTLFIKTFGADRSARYPDFGCNFETFTNEEFLELESLGPITFVESGNSITHMERWSLTKGFQEAELGQKLIASFMPYISNFSSP